MYNLLKQYRHIFIKIHDPICEFHYLQSSEEYTSHEYISMPVVIKRMFLLTCVGHSANETDYVSVMVRTHW